MPPAFVFTTPALLPSLKTHSFKSPRRILKQSPATCSISPPPTQQPEELPVLKETPVHRRIPLLGFIFDTFRNVTPLTLRLKYGPIFVSDFLGLPLTVVSEPKAISTIYKDANNFRSRGAYPPTFRELFGDKALFDSDGEAHTSRRSPVLPAFSASLFSTYFDQIRIASHSIWDNVSTATETEPIRLDSFIRDYYFRIILSITTNNNFSVGPVKDQEAEIIDLRDKFISISVGLVSFPWSISYFKALRSRNSLVKTLTALICDRLVNSAEDIDELRATGTDNFLASARGSMRDGSLDLLTVLCAMSELSTGKDVEHDETALRDLADLVLVIWFAGFSTQSTSTLCAVFETLVDKERWNRLRKEQDRIVAAAGEREISLEQVMKNMPLMDSYLNEILRMYPAAASVFRKVQNDTVVEGHLFKQGTIVNLDLFGGQRDENYYSEPNKLIMERFMKSSGKASVPVPPQVLSFGVPGGAHFCLGAALSKIMMKGTLSVMVRDYEIDLEPGQSKEYSVIPEMSPRSGVVIKSCRRRKL